MYKEEVANGVGRDENGEKQQTDLLCTRACDVARRRRCLVNFLVILFGIGAFIGVGGLLAETPLLVISAPEGSTLPSYLAMTVMLSSVGPAIYTLFNSSTSRIQYNNLFTWIISILFLGTVAMGILAFFHDVTTTIFDVDRSMVLLICGFITASLSGMRNILFLPYLKNVEDVNLTSFFIGEGLSGFMPSIVALFQGIGGDVVCPSYTTNSTDLSEHYADPPNFPARDYFLFASALLAASTASVWLFEYLRSRTSPKDQDAKFFHDHVSAEKRRFSKKLLDHESTEKALDMETMNSAGLVQTNSAADPENGNGNRIYLCALMCWVCFISNGYLATIEAFSSRPYGNAAYHLAVNCGQLAGTSACVLAYWLPPLGIRGVTTVVGLVSIGVSYTTWLAMLSPTPPWRDTTHGVILLVITWVILMGLISYVKLAITTIIWKETSDAGLFQLGAGILFGSICGCLLAFFLVTFTTLFVPFSPCALQWMNDPSLR